MGQNPETVFLKSVSLGIALETYAASQQSNFTKLECDIESGRHANLEWCNPRLRIYLDARPWGKLPSCGQFHRIFTESASRFIPSLCTFLYLHKQRGIDEAVLRGTTGELR